MSTIGTAPLSSVANAYRTALSPRDRKLLLGCLFLAVALIAVLAVFSPQEENESPSSFSNDTHGTKAAYLLLGQSGNQVERWTEPIANFPTPSGIPPILLLLEPDTADPDATRRVVRDVLARGGRVLATGVSGAALLPDGAAEPGGHGPTHTCDATPVGLGPLAGAGQVQLTTAARWSEQGPRFEVAYRCETLPLVVIYSVGRGTVVWWSSPLPMENGFITKASNLELLLASIGVPRGGRIVWDEAPPGEPPSLWSYTEGTPLFTIGWQLLLVAGLLVFSFSRRSGPLRPDPVVARASPLEFIEAMGALYGRAHATNAAVTLAYRGFLERLDRMIPVRRLAEQEGPAAAATMLTARAGAASSSETMARVLLSCEAARSSEPMS